MNFSGSSITSIDTQKSQTSKQVHYPQCRFSGCNVWKYPQMLMFKSCDLKFGHQKLGKSNTHWNVNCCFGWVSETSWPNKQNMDLKPVNTHTIWIFQDFPNLKWIFQGFSRIFQGFSWIFPMDHGSSLFGQHRQIDPSEIPTQLWPIGPWNPWMKFMTHIPIHINGEPMVHQIWYMFLIFPMVYGTYYIYIYIYITN